MDKPTYAQPCEICNTDGGLPVFAVTVRDGSVGNVTPEARTAYHRYLCGVERL